jgi:hypothetical protein
MGNSNHDERGRFASGSSSAAATGDHLAVSPSATTRNVEGRNVPRSKPVTRHADAPSVGTEGPRLSAAARDAIIRGKGIDQRAYPFRSDADVGLRTTLMGPRPITPGKLDPRLSTLISASGPKPRIRVRAR